MQVGRYEILSEIGRGGMSIVYRARSPEGREVAVKVLPRASSENALARFDRERELLGSLSEKDGFVPLLDAGEHDRDRWLVMPLVAGGSLRDRLRRGPLALGEAVALGRALAGALAVAHGRGIVHRDMKPENVLFTAEGRPLVADLGVAKRLDALAAGEGSSLSKTGSFVGTPGYLSPEQLASSRDAGPTADVFAVGAVLYECLAGRPAFPGDGLLEVCARVASGEVEPLASLRPDASAALVAIVERALSPNPRRRFAGGAELAGALAGPEVERAASAGRGARRVVVLVAIVAALASSAGIRWVVVSEREAEALREREEEAAKAALARGKDEERRQRDAAQRKKAEAVAREETRRKAEALLEEAKGELERRNAAGVIAACTRALDLDPTLPRAHHLRARARLSLGELEGALDDLGRAIELDPRSVPALELRARARILKQDHAGAIADLDRAIELDPRSVSCFTSRGNAKGAVGDLEGCAEDYSRAIAIDPGASTPWANRGNVRSLRGDRKGAMADYTKALELDPRAPSYHHNRAVLRVQEGDEAGAIEDFERFLELAPGASDAPAVRAEVVRLRGR